MSVRSRFVSEMEWAEANRKVGSVYFIKDGKADKVKIGHSFDPLRRLSELQIGSANALRLIGVVAAPRIMERVCHQEFMEGRASGQWFCDRGIISAWLDEMTSGEPLCRVIWEYR